MTSPVPVVTLLVSTRVFRSLLWYSQKFTLPSISRSHQIPPVLWDPLSGVNDDSLHFWIFVLSGTSNSSISSLSIWVDPVTLLNVLIQSPSTRVRVEKSEDLVGSETKSAILSRPNPCPRFVVIEIFWKVYWYYDFQRLSVCTQLSYPNTASRRRTVTNPVSGRPAPGDWSTPTVGGRLRDRGDGDKLTVHRPLYVLVGSPVERTNSGV